MKTKKVKKEPINYDFSAGIISRECGLALIGEYKIKGRQFRWDYAIEEINLLIEVQGGIWSAGAHGRGTGIIRDMEKLNFASCNGWRCLQYTPQEFNKIIKVIEDIKKCEKTLPMKMKTYRLHYEG